MDKLDDVWGERDFPVLLEVARRIDAADIMPNVQAVADAVGLPVEQVQLAGAALKRRGARRRGRVPGQSGRTFPRAQRRGVPADRTAPEWR